MYGKGAPPACALDAILCQHFGCLPGQLENEDGVLLLDIMYTHNMSQVLERQRMGKATREDHEQLAPLMLALVARDKN